LPVFLPRHTLILGRFLPITRTFNPLLSGNSIDVKQFMLLGGIGCSLYISALILAGYFLSNAFPQLGNYVGFIFMGVVALVLGSLVYQWLKSKQKTSREMKYGG
jgi:membrane-associated protein